MNLTTIATRNIKRRKGKVLLLIVGLGVATATLVSIVSVVFALNSRVSDELDKYGYNLAVAPNSRQLALSYGGMAVASYATNQEKPLNDSDLAKIKSVAAGRVSVINPKIMQVVETNHQQVLLAGIDISRERQVKKWWQVGFGLFPHSPNEVIVGAAAAERLDVKTGDHLLLSGKPYKVSGILFKTGSEDDEIIIGNFNKVRRDFNRGHEINLLEISAKKSGDIRPLAADLRKTLPGANVSLFSQAVKFKDKAMGRLVTFGLAVSLITIIISALIVFTTMTSSVNERRREIGIFRAIGYRQSHVAKIIFTEVFIISLAGGFVGYTFGFGLTQIIKVFNHDFQISHRPSLVLLFLSLIISVTIAMAASIVPARRAANLDPVDSLKNL